MKHSIAAGFGCELHRLVFSGSEQRAESDVAQALSFKNLGHVCSDDLLKTDVVGCRVGIGALVVAHCEIKPVGMTIAVEVIEPCPFSAQWVVVEVIPRPGIELVLIQNGEDFRRVFRSGLIPEHIELERDADVWQCTGLQMRSIYRPVLGMQANLSLAERCRFRIPAVVVSRNCVL